MTDTNINIIQDSKQKIIRSLFVRSIPSNEPEEKNKIKIPMAIR